MRGYLTLVPLLLLAGCERAVGVEALELPGGQISIVASESWNLNRPCVYQARLYRESSGRRIELWNVALKGLSEERQCVGSFTYPETPDGYEVVAGLSGAPLATGDRIIVEIHGSGFATSTEFVKR